MKMDLFLRIIIRRASDLRSCPLAAIERRGMGNYAHPKVLPMIVATGNDLGLFAADSNETTFLGACELLFTFSCVCVCPEPVLAGEIVCLIQKSDKRLCLSRTQGRSLPT
jgi:hypothetical protein